MPSPFDVRLRAMADVVLRIGLNLQPGQPLLVTDPYDLLGVHPDALPLVEAIKAATSNPVNVIDAHPARLREIALAADTRSYESLVATHVRRLTRHLSAGGAFLFLTGSAPRLLAGVAADVVTAFDRLKWQHLGSVIQRLIRGAAQWTLVPAPSRAWAESAFTDLPETERLPALWDAVFRALRVDAPLEDWRPHLAALARRRDELNAARHRGVRYVGPNTDLTVTLPGSHRWCTTQLETRKGISFVVNLPTEEIFTAPHRSSARGHLHVSRPIFLGGTEVNSAFLEFRRGRVVSAQAASGREMLDHLLAVDDGACRLGEVAIVPRATSAAGDLSWSAARKSFHHILLDENAGPHVALGDAYRFCSRAWIPLALNSSLIHVDLPLEAEVELL